MNQIDPRTRFAAVVLLVALLASLFVGVARWKVEHRENRVEIAMDYNDLVAFARSYNYKVPVLLLEMRRAGLTSLALSEELGSSLSGSSSPYGYAISGTALLDSARLAPVADPTLAQLVRSNQVRADEVFLLAYDRPSFERYMRQLPLHFERRGIRVLHAQAPFVIAVRTQPDYFNSIGLGIPADQVALAHRMGFLIEPRFQNDERMTGPQIGALFDNVGAGKWMSTVIFFGLRNQVLGFPDHVADTAAVLKVHPHTNFGMIEFYDTSQAQKGYEELAKLVPGQIVRVQAISKPELDKMNVPGIVARYELGVRERNVRVVYLRPFLHTYNAMTGGQTNVEMIRQIAQDLTANHFRLGRASPIPARYRGDTLIAYFLAALAVPSMFVLLLGFYGVYNRKWAMAAYAATLLVLVAGVATHHAELVRSLVAVAGALVFATAAFSALSPAFYREPDRSFGAQILESLKWMIIAALIALCGALVLVGIASMPLLMEEVQSLRAVKLVIALPPLIALLLYLFTDRFNAQVGTPRDALAAPIRIYQLILAAVVLGLGALFLMRSGNQSDIAPSDVELSLRHHLTVLLSVRPRFKEFLIGFPALMLIPALRSVDRRACGILLSIAAGVGLGDIIDTFSHLHTPLAISLLRVFNGAVLGFIIGVILIAVYRRFRA